MLIEKKGNKKLCELSKYRILYSRQKGVQRNIEEANLVWDSSLIVFFSKQKKAAGND